MPRNKWVYKIKSGAAGNPPRYKAHIVVKGFQQKQGVNFDKIFAPVVKMTSIQTVLSIAASMDLEVNQLDVKMAFLHGDLEEKICTCSNRKDSSRRGRRTWYAG